MKPALVTFMVSIGIATPPARAAETAPPPPEAPVLAEDPPTSDAPAGSAPTSAPGGDAGTDADRDGQGEPGSAIDGDGPEGSEAELVDEGELGPAGVDMDEETDADPAPFLPPPRSLRADALLSAVAAPGELVPPALSGALTGCAIAGAVPVVGTAVGAGALIAGLAAPLAGPVGVTAAVVGGTGALLVGPCASAGALGGSVVGAAVEGDDVAWVMLGSLPGAALGVLGAAGVTWGLIEWARASDDRVFPATVLGIATATALAAGPVAVAGVLLAQNAAPADAQQGGDEDPDASTSAPPTPAFEHAHGTVDAEQAEDAEDAEDADLVVDARGPVRF